MTLYTDNDVADAEDAVRETFHPDHPLHSAGWDQKMAHVLDAVLPKYITRLADEIEAKRPCKCTSCSAIKNLIREKANE